MCGRCAQDEYFQFFFGKEYFHSRLPCDPSNLVRFRQAPGEASLEELLATTIAAAVNMKAHTPAEFEGVVAIRMTERTGPERLRMLNSPTNRTARREFGRYHRLSSASL